MAATTGAKKSSRWPDPQSPPSGAWIETKESTMDTIEARAHLADIEDIKNDSAALCARHLDVIGHEPDADESCEDIAQNLRDYLNELICAAH